MSKYSEPGQREQTMSISGFASVNALPVIAHDEPIRLLMLLRPPHKRSLVWWLTRWWPKRVRVAMCDRYGHPAKCVGRVVERSVVQTGMTQRDDEVSYDFVAVERSETVLRRWCERCGETFA